MSENRATPASARVELDGGGVLRVILSRPDKRNALDHEAFRLIGEAFGERAHAAGVRAVVLLGEGPAFCSGLDLELLGGLLGADPADLAAGGEALQAVLDTVEACPRPTLAVVQGACIGGGVALMLACDVRVASDDALFAMQEMRYAFLPDLGHLHRLQREVGAARAKEFILFGDRMPAATLERWGVINEVVPRAQLDRAAERWMQRCAAAPPLAVAAAKRVMRAHPTGARGDRSQRAALQENLQLLRSADVREGLAAGMERRAPRFTGN